MSNEKDLIHISIEAVGSGIPLLKLNVPSSIQSNELYELVMFGLNKVDDTIILFFDYDFSNQLKETEDSMKDLYGDVKRITFALMTKILTEREILEKFYYATNGPNWDRNDNWLSDKPLNEWYGIKVHEGSEEKFIIKHLNLYSNKLEGEIPKEIGKLTNLVLLYLYNNKLEGEIPKEIGKLTNLEFLYLDSNKLEGEIPKEIGNLTNLQELCLSYNKLEGVLPKEIGKLTNLVLLYLDDNNLEGVLPKKIGKLTNLQSLTLYNNKLEGEIPKEIQELNCYKEF
jgi:hypothetical protein